MIRQLLVVLFAFVMVWYALNVPADQLTLGRQVSRGNVMDSATKTSTKIGGFPWRYCEFQDTEPLQTVMYRNWSTTNLVWNICLGLAIASVLAVLVMRNGKRVQKQAVETADGQKKGGLQISLSGLLATITIFAAVFGYYRYGTQRLADDLSAFKHTGGSCYSKLVAPRWLANAIDLSFVMHVQRGRVNGESCSDAGIARIAKMKSLTSVSVSNSNSADVCSLAALPKLRNLTLSEISLDTAIIEAIGKNESIGALSIETTTSQTPGLPLLKKLFAPIAERSGHGSLSIVVSPNEPLKLQQIPGLTSLSVTATDLNARAIRNEARRQVQTQWMVSQRVGNNTQPPKSSKGEQQASPDYSIFLSDLPDLSGLSLQTPLSTLSLKNLPKLKAVRFDFSGVSDRLVIDDLPELENLHLGMTFPKTLQLAKVPALKRNDENQPWIDVPFLVGGTSTNSGIRMEGTLTAAVARSLGPHLPELVLPRNVTLPGLIAILPQRKIKKLDFTQDLQIVDDAEGDANFESLPILESFESLKVTDDFLGSRGSAKSKTAAIYELLAKTPNLRELSVDPEFNDAHMQLVAPLKKLEIFAAANSQITDEGWKHFPQSPNLRSLSVPRRITRLDLHDLPNLNSLTLPSSDLKSIKLENLPLLNFSLNTSQAFENVSINNIGRIDHWRITKLPKSLELHNTIVQSISVFNESFTDEQLAQIVSPQLAQIVSPQLKRLILRGTKISSASLDLLLGLKQLKYLDISKTDMTEADVKRLVAELSLDTLLAELIQLSDATYESLPDKNPQSLRMRRRGTGSLPPSLD